MRHLKYLLVLYLLLVGAGCTGQMYMVKVDSINAGYESQKKNYILLPSNEGVNVNDLQFQEYSLYVKRALSRHGFKETTDFNSADVAIFLRYGISDPQVNPISSPRLVFPKIGAETSTFKASSYSSGRYSETYGSITKSTNLNTSLTDLSPPKPQPSYSRYLIIVCIDLDVYRQDKTMQQLWKTTVTSSGSSGDLREVFPILVAASDPYIGMNTGKQIEIHLNENDRRVKQIKGLE
ncbi:MAG TPA: DUF4136 domain-containing protein [Nitrospirae bacterium]|nr:hypothetical protein BMS3Abin06_00551 [bacterium BMS3Abin06]HDH11723.1 DUF4136 domain-containing protein [Nitrospirota bacterium]HDZ02559.1 DUF4136 domain-containing protein [Nitrospirota bacterium]